MDMASYAALLQEARSQQHAGHLKGAYAAYLKAHAAIMHILGTQVVFKDQVSLESLPTNHSQLVAHAQEILQRIKDIVDAARSHGAKTTAATSPSALLNSHALSLVTQRLEQAKQGSASSKSPAAGSGPRDLANLRRLIEDVRIQKAKLDAVNAQIQSVANSTITSWDPDTIARQLTIIDTSLFAKVAIPRDLVRADRKSAAAQTCIDFENYVAHSAAHLLLLEWSSSRQATSEGGLATPKGHSPHPAVNAVAHMIRVAHILLHVYRNFNSFRAIMRALTSPEVKRMHGLWSNIPSKTKDTFKRLVSTYQDQSAVTSYKEMLVQKLDAFQDVGKDAVVAIPWMRYHQDEVKSIIYSYLTGHESASGSGDVVLSAPGARKLSAVTALLMQCRTNETTHFDRSDREDSSAQAKRSKNREPVQVDGLKVPLTPVWDLGSLGAGEVTLHHWILTRPFLNKQQLIDESLEIEPLFHGEELPCLRTPLDDEDSEGWSSQGEDPTHDDSFEHVIAPEHDLEPLPEPGPQPLQDRRSSTHSPVSESDINDIMDELLNDDNDDDSDGGDLFGVSSASPSTSEPRQDPLGSKTSPGRSRDILQFLGIDTEDGSDSDDGEGHEGGDVDLPASNAVKGKGRSNTQVDEEEIQKLMAQVKGLVRDSRTYAEEVESKEVEAESGPELAQAVQGQDGDIPELPTIKPSSRFEPFREGDEEDEFGFNFNTRQDIHVAETADTIASPVNDTPKLSSLEALRRQLQAIDDAHDQASSSARTEETQLNLQTGEDKDGLQDKDMGSDKFEGDDGVPVESIQPTAAISVPAISQSSTSSSLTSHMTRIPADVLEAPPLTIGNARRRKIERDRSPNGKDHAVAIEDEQTGITAIHSSTTSAPMDTANSALEHREAEEDNSQDPEAHAAPAISIQDLDNPLLDSSPPSFEASTSTLQSPSTTAATMTTTAATATTAAATTITTSTSSLVAKDASGPMPFTLGANLFEDAAAHALNKDEYASEGAGLLQEERSEATSPSVDKSKSPGRESDAEITVGADFSDSMGEKSPEDPTEGRGRSNRQRRRIAGGVIFLGSNSKTLVSKASTSSLSKAHQEDGLFTKDEIEEERHYEEENAQAPADDSKDERK
ncbi:hypothetical protein BGZ70_000039 [Mortierella alpina]|uniref:Ras-GEF domain-containing protein n=1 Tax=Mortierella alpina TaxID=64518 RepID=A0A9P6JF23_MORAP|nr:hypothetical protein BGZ70_000039 [Mortierella alpina]